MIDDTDLVVIGSGAAGLTGALCAALDGARVVVLEKTSLVGGTSSVSGGGVWIPAHHRMGDVGVDDSREEALAYVRAIAGDSADDDVLVALVDEGPEMMRFLEKHADIVLRPYPPIGASFDYRSQLPGAKHGGRSLAAPAGVAPDTLGDWAAKLRLGPQSRARVDKLDHRAGSLHAQPPDTEARRLVQLPGETPGAEFANGTALVASLLRASVDAGVTVLLDTAATELLVEDGRVTGVHASNGSVRARNGVLVATGGFSHNAELRRLWLDRPLLGSCEIEANQGDGHLMGLAVGAQLAAVDDAAWYPQGEGDMVRQLPHSLIVSRRGRRFVNEAQCYNDLCEAFGTNTQQGGPKHLPAWVIFDGQACARYQAAVSVAAGNHGGGNIQGTPIDPPPGPGVVSAASPEELAEALGIDPNAFLATLARFNEHARVGRDPDFGRGDSGYDRAWGDPAHGPNPSLGTVEVAPFHAARIYPGSLATKGGLRVNGRAQVLAAATGEPIAGLYAAGNCSSSVYPRGYPGAGGTIGPGMTFGYIAGRRVAAAVRAERGAVAR